MAFGVGSRLAMYWRFACGASRFFATPIGVEDAWNLTATRLRERGPNLLDLLAVAVYPHHRSPCRRLLASAGCELGDVERLIASDGVEGTLERLRDAGVYFAAEELKGAEVIRGSTRFTPRAADFDNPCLPGHVTASTGGSRGRATRTIYDLEDLAARWAPHQLLRLDAYGGLGQPLLLWMPVMPGAGPIAMLAYAKGGVVPDRWFSPVSTGKLRPSLKSRLGTLAVIVAGRRAGLPLPRPEYVALGDAGVVARAVADTLRERGPCWLATYVSAAARVSVAAREEGLDLSGARFSVSSEPFTRAKQREIEACGARAYPMYAFMEAGVVALPCDRPVEPDEGHLLDDCFAVIQRRRAVAGLDVDAFLFTGLLRSSPKILVNAENGDFGTLNDHECGCRLQRAGLHRHLHTIRSFDKLTGEGMTFAGSDLARIVEEVLPAAFGGSSLDYQLCEDEGSDGRTSIVVRISPSVGAVDEGKLIWRLLEEVSRGPEHLRMAAQVWRDAGAVRVVRECPSATVRGKVLPLQLAARRTVR